MDGLTLTRELRILLREPSDSSFLDAKASYEAIYKAAKDLVFRTRCLTGTQVITTAVGTATYGLNHDFMCPAWFDKENRPFFKFTDGTSENFLYYDDYDSLMISNNTTSSTPCRGSIIDAAAVTRLTGTASAVGAVVNGECTLTDATANFLNVSPGDTVHNTTDGSSGYVIAVTSGTQLVTALFDGTSGSWATSDAYIINPQGRFALVLDPPPVSATTTATVYYVQTPIPVFSPYRSYRIPLGFQEALVFLAAWMYKQRDKEPNYADAWYKYAENEIKKYATIVRRAQNKRGYRVNMIKRAYESGSWR